MEKRLSPRHNLALPDFKISILPNKPLFKLFKPQFSLFVLSSLLPVLASVDPSDFDSSLLDSKFCQQSASY